MTPSVSKSKDVNICKCKYNKDGKIMGLCLRCFKMQYAAEKCGEERVKKHMQKALRQLKFTGFIFQGKNWVMLTEVREKIDSLTHQKG